MTFSIKWLSRNFKTEFLTHKIKKTIFLGIFFFIKSEIFRNFKKPEYVIDPYVYQLHAKFYGSQCLVPKSSKNLQKLRMPI